MSQPNQPNRRSIRLPGYDYTGPGAYFVTVCTHQRLCLFHEATLRRVVEASWSHIPAHAPQVRLDAWVVMPNHLHGILWIAGEEGAMHSQEVEPNPMKPPGNASPLPNAQRRPNGTEPGSLGAIVGNLKSVTARRINQIRRTPGMPVWQRNYYEHIIRTTEALDAIRRYIVDNPARWHLDRYNDNAVEPDPRAAELWRLLHTR